MLISQELAFDRLFLIILKKYLSKISKKEEERYEEFIFMFNFYLEIKVDT